MDPNILPPPPGSLRVAWIDPFVYIYDSQGFLCTVNFMEHLWELVRLENNEPGLLRKVLDSQHHQGTQPISSEVYWQTLGQSEEWKEKIKRYTPKGKIELDVDSILEGLEL